MSVMGEPIGEFLIKNTLVLVKCLAADGLLGVI
jgi:hypothetical protein